MDPPVHSAPSTYLRAVPRRVRDLVDLLREHRLSHATGVWFFDHLPRGDFGLPGHSVSLAAGPPGRQKPAAIEPRRSVRLSIPKPGRGRAGHRLHARGEPSLSRVTDPFRQYIGGGPDPDRQPRVCRPTLLRGYRRLCGHLRRPTCRTDESASRSGRLHGVRIALQIIGLGWGRPVCADLHLRRAERIRAVVVGASRSAESTGRAYRGRQLGHLAPVGVRGRLSSSSTVPYGLRQAAAGTSAPAGDLGLSAAAAVDEPAHTFGLVGSPEDEPDRGSRPFCPRRGFELASAGDRGLSRRGRGRERHGHRMQPGLGLDGDESSAPTAVATDDRLLPNRDLGSAGPGHRHHFFGVRGRPADDRRRPRRTRAVDLRRGRPVLTGADRRIVLARSQPSWFFGGSFGGYRAVGRSFDHAVDGLDRPSRLSYTASRSSSGPATTTAGRWPHGPACCSTAGFLWSFLCYGPLAPKKPRRPITARIRSGIRAPAADERPSS